MSLDSILDSIAGGIKSALTELKTVEVVGGSISFADKQRRSRQLPAAFVFCGGTENATVKPGGVRLTALFGVVLAVQARAEGQLLSQDRPRQIARLAGRALEVITTAKTWNNAKIEKAPSNIDSRNRYTTDADKNDIALWLITWTQDVALLSGGPPAELDDFKAIHAEWELQDGSTPAVDAVDHIELKP